MRQRTVISTSRTTDNIDQIIAEIRFKKAKRRKEIPAETKTEK